MKKEIVIENRDNVMLFGSTEIAWNYPEIYDAAKRDSIIIEMLTTRVIPTIRILFDAARDGYVISKQTKFSWNGNDDTCDPGWQEVAFIPSE